MNYVVLREKAYLSKTASKSQEKAEWQCSQLLKKNTIGFPKKMAARNFLGLTVLRAAVNIDFSLQGSLWGGELIQT